VNAAEIDGVTLDAYGTLVTLLDPVPELLRALRERGVQREPDRVLAAFRIEVAHYTARANTGGDERSLAALQRECTEVFLDEVEAEIDVEEFTPAYVGCLHFKPLPGVVDALMRLQALGLELAVVANWDLSLTRMLDEVGLTRFVTTVVHSAEKPAPDGLMTALQTLGVPAGRALHVGDDEADELAARAAGMHFAPAPLPDAVAGLS
jgi:HAD superfamily hydrolase (TIGR01509 family)